jgi:hypothetical protein
MSQTMRELLRCANALCLGIAAAGGLTSDSVGIFGMLAVGYVTTTLHGLFAALQQLAVTPSISKGNALAWTPKS